MSDALDAIARDVRRVQDAQLKLRPTPALLAFEPPRRRARIAFVGVPVVAAALAIAFVLWPRAEVLRATTTADAIVFSDGSRVSLEHAQAHVRFVDDKGATIALERGTIAGDLKANEAWAIEAGPYLARTTGGRIDVSFDGDRFVAHVLDGTLTITGPRGAATLAAGATFDDERTHPAKNDDAPTVRANDPAPQSPTQKAHVATHTQPPSAPTTSTTPEAAAPSKASDVEAGPSWQELARHDRHADAIAMVRALGVDDVVARASAADLALLGTSARLAVEVDVAKRAYETLRAKFAGAPESARAAFFLARIASDRGEHDDAARLLRMYLDEAPAGDLVAEARGRLLEELVAAGHEGEAQHEARAYLLAFPEGAHVDLARRILEDH